MIEARPFSRGGGASAAPLLSISTVSPAVKTRVARRAKSARFRRRGLAHGALEGQIRVRVKSNFARRFNVIWAVQSSREKYFASVFQKSVICSRHPASPGGAYRDRHERWAGMRWTRAARKTSAMLADGEAVWSWRPDAGAKFATTLTRRVDDGARKPGPRGSAE